MKPRHLLALAFAVPLMMSARPKPGDFITSGPASAKKVALTFDDGPGPQTARYLELLDNYGVKATFFMLAEQVKYRPKIAREVAEKGHEIASHTYNHTNYLTVYKAAAEQNPQAPGKAAAQARAQLVDDMARSRKIIEQATGARLSLLRMPHGIDRPWIKEAAREAGFVLVNWTYGGDWLKLPEAEIAENYARALKPGAILLLHDGGSRREKSLALTESLLKAAREGGYEIVTLGELIGTSAQP